MKVLVAIDSMKGSLTSRQANEIVQKVFEKYGHKVSPIAIADGGEGTLDALIGNSEEKLIKGTIHNLKNEKISAVLGWKEESKTAILESAAASGIQFIDFTNHTHPKNTSSYGTGELIRVALDLGAKRIIVGLGGTGTVDGGIGLAAALGVDFFDEAGQKVQHLSGKKLREIQSYSLENMDTRILDTELIAVSDVNNFLLGETGSVKMFGRQKGISVDELEEYEEWMKHYAAAVLYQKFSPEKGDGAAGGIGAALRIFFNAKLCPGFKFIAKETDLERKISEADLVITGEGKMDNQSLHGKVPVGISFLAKKYQIPTIAFVGSFEGKTEEFIEAGIQVVIPIVDTITTFPKALKQASNNLERAAQRTAQLLSLFTTHK